MHVCVGADSLRFAENKQKTDNLMNWSQNPLISDSRIDSEVFFWFSFSKATLTGSISLVYNQTFYREIAVVYLLSFCPIRPIFLPWKLLIFPYQCVAILNAQLKLIQIPLKWKNPPAILVSNLLWMVIPFHCIIYSFQAICKANKRSIASYNKITETILKLKLIFREMNVFCPTTHC